MSGKYKIAILGGTSHIAMNLIHAWKEHAGLCLFCRNAEKMKHFLQSIDADAQIETDFDLLNQKEFDIVVNCVGAGTPKVLATDYNRWFTVLEEFDNRCIHYLRNINPQALYVMFSSGAVYGRRSGVPAGKDSCWNLEPNRISSADFYGISKLYSEAKHRSLPNLRILDLRIFSFFSRYAKTDDGYFMTDAAQALLTGSPLKTNARDMLRDYPSPAELADLILHAASFSGINTALDAASAAPVGKLEILKALQEHFGLKVEYTGTETGTARPNGHTDIYIPTPELTASAVGWRAKKKSIEVLEEELRAIMNGKGLRNE